MEVAKSAFQTPITIKEAIDNINKKRYILPSIQREFIWKPEQIIKLFDSLMQEYPIGSFLLWGLEKERIKDYQFYEFITHYHELNMRHNPKANVTGEDAVTAVLDGQQRLTALFIGLKGSYSQKARYKKKTSYDAFPKRKLFLNLLSRSSDFDMTYDFRFLTPLEASKRDEETRWFEIGRILEFPDLLSINNYLRDKGLIASRFANECLFKLWQVVTQSRVINYYLEKSQDLDKVLNIFIRVNSGGTILSYSDLLLSIATAQWQTRDAREEITGFVEDINMIGEGFDFDKDLVLKSCLVLSVINQIAFKVANFNRCNMELIEEKWDNIAKALRIAIELVSSFGYNYETLISTNAVIPIAYYILKQENPDSFILSATYKEDRAKISKWLKSSLIKRSFSGQPDNVLGPIRKVINENSEGFPIDSIVERFKGTNKSLTFTDEDFESLLNYKYKEAHTFSVLSLLYPTLDFRNRFHKDHIHPRSFFKKTQLRKRGIPDYHWDWYMDNADCLANLQLLEGLRNEEKSNNSFEIWLKTTCPSIDERRDYMKKHFIPDIDLSFGNYYKFIEERNKLILKRLKEILQ